MWVTVPSFHSKWKIHRMTTLSPLTNTGRTHCDVNDFARASTLCSFAM